MSVQGSEVRSTLNRKCCKVTKTLKNLWSRSSLSLTIGPIHADRVMIVDSLCNFKAEACIQETTVESCVFGFGSNKTHALQLNLFIGLLNFCFPTRIDQKQNSSQFTFFRFMDLCCVLNSYAFVMRASLYLKTLIFYETWDTNDNRWLIFNWFFPRSEVNPKTAIYRTW